MNQNLNKLAIRIKPNQIKFELILLLFAFIGYIFAETAMGSHIIIISLGLLAVLYYIMAFRAEDSKIKFLTFATRLTYWSFSIGIFGILLAINHYTGADLMVQIGFSSVLLGIASQLYLKFKTKTDRKINNPDLFRAFVVGLILFLLTTFGGLSDIKPMSNSEDVDNKEPIHDSVSLEQVIN